jgi:hypothetical protein
MDEAYTVKEEWTKFVDRLEVRDKRNGRLSPLLCWMTKTKDELRNL